MNFRRPVVLCRDHTADRLFRLHRRSGRWVAVLVSILFVAAVMRLLFLAAGPPLGLLDSVRASTPTTPVTWRSSASGS